MRKLALLNFSILFLLNVSCGNQSTRKEILPHPAWVAVDSTAGRAFVVDDSNNTLSLINTSDNSVVDEEPLLDSGDTEVLPQITLAAVAINIGNSTTRLFVSGMNSQIVVFDFDGSTLTQPSFSPLTVGSGSSNIIAGLTIDPELGNLYAANASDGKIYVYDVDDGSALSGSPVTVGGAPEGLSYDSTLNLVAVANATANTVSFIDATNLAASVSTLDVGRLTSDVGLASNATGTALFIVSEKTNVVAAYQLNTSDLSTSTQISSNLAPVGPNDPEPSPNILTGVVSHIRAVSFSSGTIKGFVTQSSGDLIFLEIPLDLSTMVPGITTAGAASGEGLDIFLDSSNEPQRIYFASPGVGAVTIINAQNNLFLDQII
ncbi:MAG: hypothetical protein HYU97_06795 [Deltaproteobacteria bacterium]|nr:hypothetical protein [Deltaproteobacteria bacterium]